MYKKKFAPILSSKIVIGLNEGVKCIRPIVDEETVLLRRSRKWAQQGKRGTEVRLDGDNNYES